MAKFKDRLKMLRERVGLTQQQLADKVGFSVGAVGNWESGQNMPSRTSMRKLSALLGTTELFLSGDSDIDSGAFVEQGPEYSGALSYSRMTIWELEFIFKSRNLELSETTDAKHKRELLGIISEVSAEMQKRIPPEIETEITRRGIAAGDNREVKPEEKKK